MKKILFTLVLLFSFTVSFCQVYTYRTTEFSSRQKNNYGNWTNWDDWSPSSILVSIDFDRDIIKINSPTVQIFRITKYLRKYTDNSEGSNVEFAAIDQDLDRCHVCLRIEKNGNSQIYIRYSNLELVYGVRRID